MTSARLSPAANLLRNSKLFALPPAIPLPPAKPTVDVVFRSDTATTLHPVAAAICTDSPSLAQGDWGLKRPLPGKAFHKTSTPVIRLRSDIDTQEHIADFDSAADHVQTLQKWQNYPLMMHSGDRATASTHAHFRWSAFDARLDNTTAKSIPLPSADPALPRIAQWNNSSRQQFLGDGSESSGKESSTGEGSSLSDMLAKYRQDYIAEAEQSGRPITAPPKVAPDVQTAARRWRYEGPWIAGITNMDFEDFLKRLDSTKIAAFREHLKKSIAARRNADHRDAVVAAESEGTEAPAAPSTEVSSEEVDLRLRALRENTNAFAAEIAGFFDLPDSMPNKTGDGWLRPAGQETAASPNHRKTGPPRTHQSAGFSYLRSARYASMSPKYGPQEPEHFLPARHLKKLPYAVKNNDNSEQANQWGVGGFVVNLGQTGSNRNDMSWRTAGGGPKVAARVREAFVASDGSIQIKADLTGVKLDAGNVPIMAGEARPVEIPKGYSTTPQLDYEDDRRRTLDEARRLSEGRSTPSRYARGMSSRTVQTASPEDDFENLFRT